MGMTIKSNEYKTFALFHLFILQTYALLVTFNGFPVFEIRKNLDLRKILPTPKIFLKSRFHCITHSMEFSGNQGKHQNFDPSILPYKFGLILMGMKQKKLFFLEKKNSKWPTI